MNDTKKIVFAITASALAVLIVTLVNFILFIKNKSDFTEWCIGESITNVEDQYNSASNHTSFSPDRLIDDTDIYNCERLYQDELKWSLLCLIIMFVVYVCIKQSFYLNPYKFNNIVVIDTLDSYYCRQRSVGFIPTKRINASTDRVLKHRTKR